MHLEALVVQAARAFAIFEYRHHVTLGMFSGQVIVGQLQLHAGYTNEAQ